MKDGEQEVVIETAEPDTVDTRPYSFRDFDILAVNMHPSSGDWKDFRYTLASWLLPRVNDVSLIEIMQRVVLAEYRLDQRAQRMSRAFEQARNVRC